MVPSSAKSTPNGAISLAEAAWLPSGPSPPPATRTIRPPAPAWAARNSRQTSASHVRCVRTSVMWNPCGSDFRQALLRIAEGVETNAHLVHERQVQAAHFAIGFAKVIEDAARLDLPAATAEHHHGQLIVVMVAGHHAGAEHDHRVVQQRPLALLD